MTESAKKALPAAERSIHGHTKGGIFSPTYRSWQAMIARCRYVDRDVKKKHSGRGISVNPRWLRFDNFLADMGKRPVGTSIDRIDNDGDYGPGNCRWATPTAQARNRRNSVLTYDTAYQACWRILSGEHSVSVSRDLGCSESLPREIASGRTWRDASAAAHADMRRYMAAWEIEDE